MTLRISTFGTDTFVGDTQITKEAIIISGSRPHTVQRPEFNIMSKAF